VHYLNSWDVLLGWVREGVVVQWLGFCLAEGRGGWQVAV
jgi:hypothetical protein